MMEGNDEDSATLDSEGSNQERDFATLGARLQN